MEEHINTRQMNDCEATLKLDITFCSLLLLSALEALHHGVSQHLLDLLKLISQ